MHFLSTIKCREFKTIATNSMQSTKFKNHLCEIQTAIVSSQSTTFCEELVVVKFDMVIESELSVKSLYSNSSYNTVDVASAFNM